MKIRPSRFTALYVFGAVFLAVSLVVRVALATRAWPFLDVGPGTVAAAMAVGFFFDLVTLLYIFWPGAILLAVLPDRLVRWKPVRYAAMGLYFVGVAVLLFSAVAEWYFWEEFEARFNFVAVDYLVYTHEVIGNALESYPVTPVILGLLVAAGVIVVLTRRPFLHAFDAAEAVGRRLVIGAGLTVAAVAAMVLVDSTLSRISPNRYACELAKNGPYSFFDALWHNEIDYEQFYRTEDPTAAFARARQLVKTDDAEFVGDDPLSLTRRITPPGPEKRWNLVILVVESLSAKYLGAFGATDGATPNLDALADQSLFFTNFYATGTRTDRGLEAVTASLPPTPGRSMVKRPDNGNLFTIGQILADRGYARRFIYSGYSTFDNMDTYFTDNGFDAVDGADFSPGEVTFSNAWGACDEDLYRRVIKEADLVHPSGRPFCFVTLTTSNHRPYTHPETAGIENGTRRGAVQYTDYAIGRFLAQARSAPWFDNTLFVIVADHCASSAGKTDVPIHEYHIPLFIYAPKLVSPRRIDKLSGQMDVAPTLLGLINCSYTSRFFGRDILGSGEGRALVGNYEKVGLYKDGKLQLLLLKRKTQAYDVADDGTQSPCKVDSELLADTISYYQSAAYLLSHHRYTAMEHEGASVVAPETKKGIK